MLVNKRFLNQLEQQPDKFGFICQCYMKQFECCYRKYLLEQEEAQRIHTKEYKNNLAYKKFLLKVSQHPEFKKKRLQDILMEPVQRISRYSMMLKNILSLTPSDHPDYWGLKWACDKSREIAIMDDDDTTKKITLLMTLYQIIKDSPVNKILVASRSCCFDIEQLENKALKNTAKNTLKFKGWADIKSIELSVGLPGHEGWFILSAIKKEEDVSTFERYFHKGPKLFFIKDQQRLLDFQSVYNKTRALRRQFESSDKIYYQLWNNVPVFCNVYNQDTFIKSKYKSPCVLVYVDQEDLDAETISSSSSSIIGLVQPEGLNGFRFHLATTTRFAEPFRPYLKGQQSIVDFESIFWNNIIFLNQCLQLSLETLDPVLPLNNISRSESSIPKFHRLFGHEDLTQVKSLPSLSRLEVANKRTSSHSWNDITTIRHPSLMSLFSFHSKSSEEDKRKMADDLMLDEASCFC
ncbi:hypothetical protein G6F57_000049 [Rhizopus arrhizus]|uniref:DH domain-containing protein n=1 Tax=Rhizopus oryzae TaxID=64495 RepID=A0A9P6XHV5_RHIOR|nr:hypothetical protein G6F23_005925 [Rhizopus arrhizus]KAG1413635.1 hypothetical protein G6F58_007379 [Rhizopus delemar]KAG0756976.1 hypothetical protein G6F24_010793 [Rhizopus arrhizus]KAG0783860.1 hypothetical protein G6F21_010273 [Rhizopus arrhizus]KAG0801351.1 hypothetical protein G6F22_001332 [Rhizopus arrhizus]